MAIYSLILLFLWVAFYIYWIASAFGVKKNIARGSVRRGMGIRLIVLAIVLILIFSSITDHWLDAHTIISQNPALALLGLILCAAGITFAIWARVHLGRNWGMPMSLKEGHELVTSGPYRYVRHPIYSGLLFAMLASALVSGISWLIVFIFFGIYFIYAAKTEEGIMVRQFPNEYPEYKKRSKMLVPFLF